MKTTYLSVAIAALMAACSSDPEPGGAGGYTGPGADAGSDLYAGEGPWAAGTGAWARPAPAPPPAPADPDVCAVTNLSGLWLGDLTAPSREEMSFVFTWTAGRDQLTVVRSSTSRPELAGTWRLSFDGGGRLVEVAGLRDGNIVARESITLDDRGFPSAGRWENGGEVAGSFARDNRYDAEGRLRGWAYTAATGSYDQWARARGEVLRQAGGRVIRVTVTGVPRRVDTAIHTLDVAGRLVQTDLHQPDTWPVRTSFQYDPSGRMHRRLVQGLFGRPPPQTPVDQEDIGGDPNHVTEYHRDDSGRITWLRGYGATLLAPPALLERSFSPGCEALRGSLPGLFNQPDPASVVGFSGLGEPGDPSRVLTFWMSL